MTGKQLAVDSELSTLTAKIRSDDFVATAATLESVGFSGGYSFANGGIGAFDGCHTWYLNIQSSVHSYKPL